MNVNLEERFVLDYHHALSQPGEVVSDLGLVLVRISRRRISPHLQDDIDAMAVGRCRQIGAADGELAGKEVEDGACGAGFAGEMSEKAIEEDIHGQCPGVDDACLLQIGQEPGGIADRLLQGQAELRIKGF
ncbi:MAG: hypothetical protein ACD_75C00062G0001 [uncultured bacterium]|nr:MAG: hypothetical protein ACD_75C00062G0001 [uncultured bacterium]